MAPGHACALLLLGLVCASGIHLQEVPAAKNEMKECTGSRSSFDAGFGGCDVYATGRNMNRFCERDVDEKQGLFASQACDECGHCSGGDQARKAVKAYGDPHMVNVFGQRFDLMRAGEHSLVQIPRGVGHKKSLLRVVANASRVGVNCEDMYIMNLNVTGGWVERAADRNRLHFEAGVSDASQSHLYDTWLHFGAVDLKVAQGTTMGGTAYLNFFVRKLTKTGYHVGGLLGEDSHEVEAAPDGTCRKHAVSLIESAGKAEGVQLPTRSTAEAVDVM